MLPIESLPSERLLKGLTLAERRRARRDALLGAALELFGTQGYAATSVEEICRRAFVSTRNFYEEFANREAVLLALGRQVADRVHVALTDSGGESPRLAARARVAAVVHALVDDPRISRLAFVETVGINREQAGMRRAAHRRYARWLVEHVGADLSELGIDPRHQEGLALGLVGAASELISDWVLRPARPPVEDLIELIVELAMIVLRRPVD